MNNSKFLTVTLSTAEKVSIYFSLKTHFLSKNELIWRILTLLDHQKVWLLKFKLRTLWILNNQCIILHHSSKREAKRSYLIHLAIHKVSKDSHLFFVPPPDSNLYSNSHIIGSGSECDLPVLVWLYPKKSHFWYFQRKTCRKPHFCLFRRLSSAVKGFVYILTCNNWVN